MPDLLDSLVCPGEDGLSQLTSLQTATSQTGLYPFIIGGPQDFEVWLESVGERNENDLRAVIEASQDINLNQWMADKANELWSYSDKQETLGQWPSEYENLPKARTSFHCEKDSFAFKSSLYLGKTPISQSWMLPAVNDFGGWNECPPAEVHCAFHRYWQHEYGAEIVSLSNDVIECWVKCPPQTNEAVTKLAWEQFYYAEDIVLQGADSISRLAFELLKSPYWYFWWD